MSAAAERATRLLNALPAEDREWILARLSEEARARLRPVPAAEETSAVEVAEALRDEPDWFVALLLASRRWPWDRQYLAGLERSRVEALREAGRLARPRACEAAVAAFEAKLKRLAPPQQAPSVFDDVLSRMSAWR